MRKILTKKRLANYIALAICLLFHVPTTYSQEPTYIHFEPEIDIPFSTTYGDIVQDSSGYIWFGTDSGLYRYDGDVFEQIPMSEDIQDIEVFDLKMDKYETLWYISLTGKLCYVTKARDSIRIFNPDNLMDTCSILQFKLQKDQVFFQTKSQNKTFSIFSFTHHSDKDENIKSEYASNGLYDFAYDDQNQLIVSNWFHQNGNMDFFTIDSTNKKRQFSFHFNRSPKVIFIHDQSHLYLIVNSLIGGKTFCKTNRQFVEKKLFQTPTAINNWYAKNDKLWVLTNNGCYTYNKTTCEASLFRLKDHDVFSMLIDREGGQWFGINGKGVYYYPPNTLYSYQKTPSLGNQTIQKIQKIQNGPYVISTTNKILFIDPKTLRLLSTKIDLSDKAFNIYVQGSHIFISTQLKYLKYKYNHNTGQVSLENDYEISSKLTIPLNDKKFVASGASFLKLITNSKIENILDERVTDLCKDTFASTIWVGGVNRAYYIEYNSHTITHPIPFPSISNVITKISADKNNCVWFATASSGLIKYNKKNKKIRKYPFLINGKANKIDQISCNNPNKIWLSSFNKLYSFDIKKEIFQTQRNIKDIIRTPILTLWDTNDTILIGTKKGLFLDFVDQSSIIPSPHINIESIKINFIDTFVQTKYDLTYRQNNIQLNFNSIGAFSPLNRAKIYYKINHKDSWHLAPNNQLLLTNLAPDSYKIIAKSVYKEDQTNYNTLVVHLEIHKPFWKTLWFNLLVIFACTMLAFFWFYKKKQQIALKRTRTQESEKLKNAVLQLQMNPHFIFNSMNTIIYYITVANKEKSIQILTKLSRLIRQIFVFSNKKLIPLSTELQFLSDYLDMEQERFAEKIVITRVIEQEAMESSFPIPPLMVQPILENSFKHGLFHKKGHGVLRFSAFFIKNGVKFVIEDDGVGRNFKKSTTQSKKTSSYDVINSRIQLINQSTEEFSDIFVQFAVIDLVNDQDKPLGTRSTITFKKKKR